MLVFTDNIRLLVIWSLVAGGILCLVYDIVRASRSFFGVSVDVKEMKKGRLFVPKIIYLFISDFLFCVFSAICFLVVSYCQNGGVFRGLILVCGALGFIIIRATLSKIFMFLLIKAVFVLKKLIGFLYFVLRRGLVKIAKPFFWLYHLTLGRIVCIIKSRIKEKRELKELRRMQLSGKGENVAIKEAQEYGRKKRRIIIGRREEEL